MKKFNVFVEVFNPRRGFVKILLCSVYARSIKEANALAKREVKPNEPFSLTQVN